MAEQVYFIENVETGRIKVGFTDGSVAARLRALQTGSDARLRLLGVLESNELRGTTERQLHRRFRGYHYRGEWFSKEIYLLVRELLETF